MNATAYYQDKLAACALQIANFKKARNMCVFAKLLFFVGFVVAVYYAFNGLHFVVPALCLIAYVFFVVVDSRVVKRMRLQQSLANVCTQELDYLSGKIDDLPNGEAFADAEHAYALDLDIFGNNSLFQELNRCFSADGQMLMAKELKELSIDAQKIRKRQEASAELSADMDFVLKYRAMGGVHKFKPFNQTLINEWKKVDYGLPGWLRNGLLVLSTATIILLLLAIFKLIPYGYSVILIILQFLISIFAMAKISKAHAHVGEVIASLVSYTSLIASLAGKEFESDELKDLQEKLNGELSAFDGFHRLKQIQDRFDQRSNVLVAIMLNALYLRDIHSLYQLVRWCEKYADYIEEWITQLSKFEVFSSLACYRFNHPNFIVPKLEGNSIIEAVNLAHPMMRGSGVVSNDFKLAHQQQMYIVTGANMSGKSTFLRSVGINFVLAHFGAVVSASSFSFTPMSIFTSMRTTDNLHQGKSFFQAELLRLRAMVDLAEQGKPIFVILDEMLKGTNSTDKLNGSLQFLKALLKHEVCGLVATHDLELGKLANDYPDNFSNICFEIEHVDNQITYSYKLQKGISQNMNASILLKQLNLI